MEELMECPICHTTYSGKKKCPRCQVPLQPVKPAEPEPVEEKTESAIEAEPSADPGAPVVPDYYVECPECGRRGEPGSECPICGTLLPGGVKEQAVCEVPGVLHDGTKIALPVGKAVILGRESDNECVRGAFARYDVVSRKHCEIVIKKTGDAVTVRDCGSTNHTYVNEERAFLKKNEVRAVKLPATIRLGQRVSIRIGGE